VHRRAAVPGPANPLVIVVVVAGLVMVALVGVVARAGALGTAANFVDFPAAALTAQQRAAVKNAIGAFLGCLPITCPATAKAAAPITQVDATDAPVLVVNSDAELVPVDQAQRMAAALQAAGVREQLVVLPGHLHAAAYASQAWDQTVAFLGHELGPPKP
jgi:acetyl esterase/lipase